MTSDDKIRTFMREYFKNTKYLNNPIKKLTGCNLIYMCQCEAFDMGGFCKDENAIKYKIAFYEPIGKFISEQFCFDTSNFLVRGCYVSPEDTDIMDWICERTQTNPGEVLAKLSKVILDRI